MYAHVKNQWFSQSLMNLKAHWIISLKVLSFDKLFNANLDVLWKEGALLKSIKLLSH
jgi:hypothetical protein